MHQPNLTKALYAVLRTCFDYIHPKLSNYRNFSRSLTRMIDENGPTKTPQYLFDVKLDEIVQKGLRQQGISGNFFSEESGFYQWGEKKYRIVFDPFCNSSLAARAMLEAAIGISIFSYEYKFITSAILDYQTGIVGMVRNGKTHFVQIQDLKPVHFNFPPSKRLEDAWVVMTLEDEKERVKLFQATNIVNRAHRLLASSGHIYWLRLAAGLIDVYADPLGGEKLYEMFACTVAQGSGCTVTNLRGEEFDAGKYLHIFEQNPEFLYYPVAARTAALHREVLAGITTSGKASL